MAYEVRMPQLGLTMEEGTVSRWLKQEGDPIQAGEALLEITTDKLTNEVISEQDGILVQIVAQEGEDVPVKGLLCHIAQPDEAADVVSVSAEVSNRIRISPLAKKTAAKMGVDYTNLAGTGTGGRIVQKDILAAAQKALPTPSAPVETPEAVTRGCTEKMTPMRRTVAQRMLKAHTEIPSVTQVTKVDVTELVKLRKELMKQTGRKFSVNDLILKATAKVLHSHPEMLVSYEEGCIRQHDQVHLGMAVALDAGLIVPVIRDADKLGLEALSDAAKEIASRAKENRLKPEEFQGSTFSVSNLGMFGVESFNPIINQPNAAILGVCEIQDELCMEDSGMITKHQFLRLCLTYDHRLLDGAAAARFSMDLRDMLQSPVRIIL